MTGNKKPQASQATKLVELASPLLTADELVTTTKTPPAKGKKGKPKGEIEIVSQGEVEVVEEEFLDW